MSKLPDHWNRHAAQWRWIGPPLRPAEEDIRVLERALQNWHAANPLPSPQAVLLGVTPEITRMRWPPGTRVVAVDHSEAMIRALWQGAELGYVALCSEWLRLPLRAGMHDIVVGDGCFSTMVNRGEYRALTGAVRTIMRERGVLLMRYFIRPEERESVSAVIDDLTRGRIGNFHVFKWRLAMALHGNLDEGVRLADIWEAWRAAVPEPEQLAARLGWPLRAVLTIDAYQGVETRYTFPTLAEARAAITEAFCEIECIHPAYELGERCPTLVLRPR